MTRNKTVKPESWQLFKTIYIYIYVFYLLLNIITLSDYFLNQMLLIWELIRQCGGVRVEMLGLFARYFSS